MTVHWTIKEKDIHEMRASSDEFFVTWIRNSKKHKEIIVVTSITKILLKKGNVTNILIQTNLEIMKERRRRRKKHMAMILACLCSLSLYLYTLQIPHLPHWTSLSLSRV